MMWINLDLKEINTYKAYKHRKDRNYSIMIKLLVLT